MCLVLSGLKLQAQISTEELPVSFSFKENTLQFDIETARSFPRLDMEAIYKEDREREDKNLPPRFGYRHPVHFTLNNSGQWTTTPNGDRLWKLDIYCPEALSVNLLYDKFHLPERAKFFVYSSDKKHSIGAFTSINNKGTKENPQGFATGLVYGDKITLEYYQPKEVTDEGIISIAYAVHGYRYIYPPESSENITASGACQVNVNCSEGENWQNEKNAVALILVNGNAWCSGSLLNTAANDARPLFLTADHCLDCKYDALGDSVLNHYSFYWNYESPDCTPTAYPTPKSTAGAVVVANNSATDFALLRLTEDPRNKQDVNTYYLGWDRTGNAGTEGAGIHHPAGDVKKISTHNISPANTDCLNTIVYCIGYMPNSNLWKINWMETTHGHSVMEGGSSGSPLFNNDHRVIGQAFGGGDRDICPDPGCGNPSASITNYGKFSVSWDNDTNPKRRLKDWLDPNNTGVSVLDGMECTTVNFTNQTVTTDTTVTGCYIYVQNVTVTNGATLTFDAASGTLIGNNVEVQLGSQLEMQ
jgi:hypothetical protein